jgi:hypothetical protein
LPTRADLDRSHDRIALFVPLIRALPSVRSDVTLMIAGASNVLREQFRLLDPHRRWFARLDSGNTTSALEPDVIAGASDVSPRSTSPKLNRTSVGSHDVIGTSAIEPELVIARASAMFLSEIHLSETDPHRRP